ncbi:phytanoyl-CoA dioxygenase family protein [Armatimonas rosea]|uniref:Ectoine hydroxylase-related dioxygenase (Phytanoyl-CoA dioxygenase family) n=1 Tax=Armatimonas rosea TaxID=685828 RepID=A0A7W9SUX0_ARMRO|nr:phytanoyl-CoA dioxygenase family protein [Armatimonas rosea]MBB6052810.1 ectoine hydroxylase-related dioxygenase (phytanoyl-CoA dioxygenase family) [Armatimonas rosea]
MKNQLSEAQLASYRENGFLVIENFLDSGELAHWQKTTQEAVDQRLALTAAGVSSTETNRILSNQHNPDSYYAQVFTQCIKLLETHDGMKELMLDPRLGELAATLAGVDGIRIWHDQALFKPPFGNPTGWHLDNPYWSFSTRDTLSLWVALDDATLGNGCMWYIPGSHKTATWENAGIGQNMSDLFKLYPQWREIEPVACPCPAGSAVFHNGLTAHGAGANMTNKPRRAMTCGYMPDGATFNGQQNILPDDYFQSLKIGDVLNNDTLNPLVWKKAAP